MRSVSCEVGFTPKNRHWQPVPTFWEITGSTVTKTLLSTLGGTNGIASDINDAGLAVGYSYLTGNSFFHATLWDTTEDTPTAKDLGTLGGSTSEARAINESGKVVGHSTISGNGESHAALWDGTSIIDLGTLGGTDSSAFDINDTGTIVGGSSLAGDIERRATIWTNNSIIDLNTLVDLSGVGWLLIDARGINSSGQIVGVGINPDGEERAYLLTPNPVPLPAALPLLMSALGVFGFFGWRRKRMAVAA